jgi:hypothetical protein
MQYGQTVLLNWYSFQAHTPHSVICNFTEIIMAVGPTWRPHSTRTAKGFPGVMVVFLCTELVQIHPHVPTDYTHTQQTDLGVTL